jgi:precorrin-6B methylase 1
MSRPGQLIVVGCGIALGRHVSERTLSEIRLADHVLVLADAFALDWLKTVRPDCTSLTGYYGESKDRRQTYREMEAVILASVRAGKRVCAVFYGHPGVFAQVSHAAIATARKEGYPARMEPGISAGACLYADLGMDPGEAGVQSCEATRFLISRWPVNPAALLILWQVALTGNLDCIGFKPDRRRLQLLVDKLQRWYLPDAPVILYEAAQLPVESFRAERLPLAELSRAGFKEYTTLVIPPVFASDPDKEILARISSL